MQKSVLVLVVLGALFVTACGSGGSTGGGSSPAAPSSTTPAVTRIINVSGSLNFGDVTVGDSKTNVLTITNSGNSTLTITGFSGPCASAISLSWSGGTISAGASQTVSVRFGPTSAQSCTGTVTVSGDFTSGTSTVAMTATAVAGYSKILTGTWRGTLVVDTVVYLTQSGSNLSGEYNAVNVKGNVSGSINNKGAVTFTVTISGYAPFTFTGQADDAGNTISGQVNGSGFSNSAWTLRRQ